MSDKQQEQQTMTGSIRNYLDSAHIFQPVPVRVTGDTTSILERANAAGLTLMQYVAADPDKAIREAEATLSEWLRIQGAAAIEGKIVTDNGTYMINKNTTKLIELRVDHAQKELDKINELAYTTFSNGERRRDHLIRALYNRAIHKGDTKAMLYLIDRVDGRPTEARAPDLDYDNAYNVYQIVHTLFDKQLQVLNSGSGTKLICTSRRSGKTHLLTAACMIECLRIPNTMCIYIGETLELTEQLIDSAANQIVDSCKLRDREGKRLNWKKFDNGSKILVRGLSSTKDPDQIRGHKAKIVVIDEFFHLHSDLLQYLQQEVLQPMQLDYADSYMFLCAGTPPSIKGTFGEYAWKNWDVPHFYWTYKDNPHPVDVQAREDYVDHILHEKGLDRTSTYARREFGGEWIYDEDLLLYPEFYTYNPDEAIPQFHIDMVLFGIDYGVSDSDTLLGIAWDSAGRRGYVFHEDKFNRLDIKDRTVSQLEYLRSQIKIAWQKGLAFFGDMSPKEANKRVLWDADDNNQHITDDFNCNVRLDADPDLRLNIQNAHKTDKVMMYDKIRDLLRTASLLLPHEGKTARECEMTVLKRGPNGQVFPEVDLGIYHPDLLPAMRYALWNVIGQEVYKSAADEKRH